MKTSSLSAKKPASPIPLLSPRQRKWTGWRQRLGLQDLLQEGSLNPSMGPSWTALGGPGSLADQPLRGCRYSQRTSLNIPEATQVLSCTQFSVSRRNSVLLCSTLLRHRSPLCPAQPHYLLPAAGHLGAVGHTTEESLLRQTPLTNPTQSRPQSWRSGKESQRERLPWRPHPRSFHDRISVSLLYFIISC